MKKIILNIIFLLSNVIAAELYDPITGNKMYNNVFSYHPENPFCLDMSSEVMTRGAFVSKLDTLRVGKPDTSQQRMTVLSNMLILGGDGGDSGIDDPKKNKRSDMNLAMMTLTTSIQFQGLLMPFASIAAAEIRRSFQAGLKAASVLISQLKTTFSNLTVVKKLTKVVNKLKEAIKGLKIFQAGSQVARLATVKATVSKALNLIVEYKRTLNYLHKYTHKTLDASYRKRRPDGNILGGGGGGGGFGWKNDAINLGYGAGGASFRPDDLLIAGNGGNGGVGSGGGGGGCCDQFVGAPWILNRAGNGGNGGFLVGGGGGGASGCGQGLNDWPEQDGWGADGADGSLSLMYGFSGGGGGGGLRASSFLASTIIEIQTMLIASSVPFFGPILAALTKMRYWIILAIYRQSNSAFYHLDGFPAIDQQGGAGGTVPNVVPFFAPFPVLNATAEAKGASLVSLIFGLLGQDGIAGTNGRQVGSAENLQRSVAGGLGGGGGGGVNGSGGSSLNMVPAGSGGGGGGGGFNGDGGKTYAGEGDALTIFGGGGEGGQGGQMEQDELYPFLHRLNGGNGGLGFRGGGGGQGGGWLIVPQNKILDLGFNRYHLDLLENLLYLGQFDEDSDQIGATIIQGGREGLKNGSALPGNGGGVAVVYGILNVNPFYVLAINAPTDKRTNVFANSYTSGGYVLIKRNAWLNIFKQSTFMGDINIESGGNLYTERTAKLNYDLKTNQLSTKKMDINMQDDSSCFIFGGSDFAAINTANIKPGGFYTAGVLSSDGMRYHPFSTWKIVSEKQDDDYQTLQVNGTNYTGLIRQITVTTKNIAENKTLIGFLSLLGIENWSNLSITVQNGAGVYIPNGVTIPSGCSFSFLPGSYLFTDSMVNPTAIPAGSATVKNIANYLPPSPSIITALYVQTGYLEDTELGFQAIKGEECWDYRGTGIENKLLGSIGQKLSNLPSSIRKIQANGPLFVTEGHDLDLSERSITFTFSNLGGLYVQHGGTLSTSANHLDVSSDDITNEKVLIGAYGIFKVDGNTFKDEYKHMFTPGGVLFSKDNLNDTGEGVGKLPSYIGWTVGGKAQYATQFSGGVINVGDDGVLIIDSDFSGKTDIIVQRGGVLRLNSNNLLNLQNITVQGLGKLIIECNLDIRFPIAIESLGELEIVSEKSLLSSSGSGNKIIRLSAQSTITLHHPLWSAINPQHLVIEEKPISIRTKSTFQDTELNLAIINQKNTSGDPLEERIPHQWIIAANGQTITFLSQDIFNLAVSSGITFSPANLSVPDACYLKAHSGSTLRGQINVMYAGAFELEPNFINNHTTDNWRIEGNGLLVLSDLFSQYTTSALKWENFHNITVDKFALLQTDPLLEDTPNFVGAINCVWLINNTHQTATSNTGKTNQFFVMPDACLHSTVDKPFTLYPQQILQLTEDDTQQNFICHTGSKTVFKKGSYIGCVKENLLVEPNTTIETDTDTFSSIGLKTESLVLNTIFKTTGIFKDIKNIPTGILYWICCPLDPKEFLVYQSIGDIPDSYTYTNSLNISSGGFLGVKKNQTFDLKEGKELTISNGASFDVMPYGTVVFSGGRIMFDTPMNNAHFQFHERSSCVLVSDVITLLRLQEIAIFQENVTLTIGSINKPIYELSDDKLGVVAIPKGSNVTFVNGIQRLSMLDRSVRLVSFNQRGILEIAPDSSFTLYPEQTLNLNDDLITIINNKHTMPYHLILRSYSRMVLKAGATILENSGARYYTQIINKDADSIDTSGRAVYYIKKNDGSMAVIDPQTIIDNPTGTYYLETDITAYEDFPTITVEILPADNIYYTVLATKGPIYIETDAQIMDEIPGFERWRQAAISTYHDRYQVPVITADNLTPLPNVNGLKNIFSGSDPDMDEFETTALSGSTVFNRGANLVLCTTNVLLDDKDYMNQIPFMTWHIESQETNKNEGQTISTLPSANNANDDILINSNSLQTIEVVDGAFLYSLAGFDLATGQCLTGSEVTQRTLNIQQGGTLYIDVGSTATIGVLSLAKGSNLVLNGTLHILEKLDVFDGVTITGTGKVTFVDASTLNCVPNLYDSTRFSSKTNIGAPTGSSVAAIKKVVTNTETHNNNPRNFSNPDGHIVEVSSTGHLIFQSGTFTNNEASLIDVYGQFTLYGGTDSNGNKIVDFTNLGAVFIQSGATLISKIAYFQNDNIRPSWLRPGSKFQTDVAFQSGVGGCASIPETTEWVINADQALEDLTLLPNKIKLNPGKTLTITKPFSLSKGQTLTVKGTLALNQPITVLAGGVLDIADATISGNEKILVQKGGLLKLKNKSDLLKTAFSEGGAFLNTEAWSDLSSLPSNAQWQIAIQQTIASDVAVKDIRVIHDGNVNYTFNEIPQDMWIVVESGANISFTEASLNGILELQLGSTLAITTKLTINHWLLLDDSEISLDKIAFTPTSVLRYLSAPANNVLNLVDNVSTYVIG